MPKKEYKKEDIDHKKLSNRSSKPEGLMQLSDVFRFAHVFRGSIVFPLAPYLFVS